MPETAPPPSADAPPTPVEFEHIVAAGETIRGVAHRTPVETCAALDEIAGARVFCKCENLQRVGAFKFRGAYNAMSALKRGEPGAGALAYSSGNHAQGMALSAALLGVPTTIVMPNDAPEIKRAATEAYLARAPKGSGVHTYNRGTEVREEIGGRIALERGLTIIPPFDHPVVIAGQGTAGMELFEDVGPLDEVYVCVGGGGLLSGCAIAARAMAPGCRVIGVEPEAADDAARSFRDRTLHVVHEPPTIADGARTPSLGRWTFPLVLQHVDEMTTVTDDELREVVRFVFARMKLVIEPTGALAIAGLLKTARIDPERVRGKRIGAIISGGNVDASTFAAILSGS
ncbi:MAG: pyridoxal-phosphate dependent enzyme [Planctomycetota bacterium]